MFDSQGTIADALTNNQILLAGHSRARGNPGSLL